MKQWIFWQLSCLCVQILVCVVINLTLVYAIISYSAVKKQMATSEQGVRCYYLMLHFDVYRPKSCDIAYYFFPYSPAVWRWSSCYWSWRISLQCLASFEIDTCVFCGMVGLKPSFKYEKASHDMHASRFSPIVLVMLPFTIITNTGHFHILDHVYKCTCWFVLL